MLAIIAAAIQIAMLLIQAFKLIRELFKKDSPEAVEFSLAAEEARKKGDFTRLQKLVDDLKSIRAARKAERAKK